MTPLKQQISLILFSIEHWYSPYKRRRFENRWVTFKRYPRSLTIFVRSPALSFRDRKALPIQRRYHLPVEDSSTLSPWHIAPYIPGQFPWTISPPFLHGVAHSPDGAEVDRLRSGVLVSAIFSKNVPPCGSVRVSSTISRPTSFQILGCGWRWS